MVEVQAGVYAYPWDLLDEGVETALERIAGLGLEAVNVAATYHSGKFLSPRSRRRRIYFPEGGVVYFKPSEGRFKDLPIQPVVSELVNVADLLDSLVQPCKKLNLQLISWVVGTHNTRLGLRHPTFTARNAYGDSYIYALCPSHEAVREYVKAIVEDLVDQYAVDAIEVESIGYMGFYHGYHHEFYSVSLGLYEQCLLALCFCSGCERLGREAGLDVARLKSEVRAAIDGKLNEPVDHQRLTADSTAELLDFLLSQEALSAYIRKRGDVITGFITELTQSVHRKGLKLYCLGPVFARPRALGWVEGLDVRAIGRVVDRFEVALYFEDYGQRAAEAFSLARLQLACEVGAAINVGHPYSRSYEDLLATVQLVKRAGFCSVGFYNYGTLPEYRLGWIRDAVRSVREEL